MLKKLCSVGSRICCKLSRHQLSCHFGPICAFPSWQLQPLRFQGGSCGVSECSCNIWCPRPLHLAPDPSPSFTPTIVMRRQSFWDSCCLDISNKQTLQALRMLSSVAFNCQVTKIVMNSGSQLSEF